MSSISVLALLAEVPPVLVAIAVYLPAALESECCWYDDMAVPSNLDVVGVDSSPTSVWGRGLWPLLTNDFWGTPMAHADSHKSWRPITVASFRLDVLVTWFFSGSTTASPAEHSMLLLPTTEILRDIFQSQPVVARVHQVAAHALVVWLFTRLAKRIFARLQPANAPSSPTVQHQGGIFSSGFSNVTGSAAVLTSGDTSAIIAGLIFAAHPVHAESVGALVGRAELLCAACYFLALLSWLGPTNVAASPSGSTHSPDIDASRVGKSAETSLSTTGIFLRAVKCVVWAGVALMCKEQGALAPLVPVAAYALAHTVGIAQNWASSYSNAESSHKQLRGILSPQLPPWVSLGVLLIGSLALVLGRLCLFGSALPAFSSVRQNPLLALGGPQHWAWWAGVGYANARHLSLLAWPWQPLCHDWSGSLLPGRLAMVAKTSTATSATAAEHAGYIQSVVASIATNFGVDGSGASSPWQWALHALAGLACLVSLLWWLLLTSPFGQESFKSALRSKGSGRMEAKELEASRRDAETWAAAWGAALLLVPMLPTSHVVFKVGFFLAERTLLVPSAGAALLASLSIRRLTFAALALLHGPSQLQQQQQRPTSASRVQLSKHKTLLAVVFTLAAIVIAPMAVVSLLAKRSFVRSWDWTQEVRLYESALKALPDAPSLLYSMANMYGNQLKDMQRGQQMQQQQSTLRQQQKLESLEADAVELYWRTLEVEPTYYEAHSNLATLLEGQGKWAAALAVLFDADQLDWDGMDGVPPASNPGRRAARAGLRHNRGLLLGQLYERSLLSISAPGDRFQVSASLWPVAAAVRTITTAAGETNPTTLTGRDPEALVSLSESIKTAAALGAVASRAAAAESAAANAASTKNAYPVQEYSAQGRGDDPVANEVLHLAVDALRSAAMLSPHYDSLTEAGRLNLLPGRTSDAKNIFLEALEVHSTSPYPPLNLALLALRGDRDTTSRSSSDGENENGGVELSLDALASSVSHLRETLWRHFTRNASTSPKRNDDITELCTESSLNSNTSSRQCNGKSSSSPADIEISTRRTFEVATSCPSDEHDVGASRLQYALAVLHEAVDDLDFAHFHARAALGCLGSDGSEQASDGANDRSSRSGDDGRVVPGVGGVSGGGAGSSSSRNRRPFLNVPEIYNLPPRETLVTEVADLTRRARLKNTRALAQRLAQEDISNGSNLNTIGAIVATPAPSEPTGRVSAPSGGSPAAAAAPHSKNTITEASEAAATNNIAPSIESSVPAADAAAAAVAETPVDTGFPPSGAPQDPFVSLEVVVDGHPQRLEVYWLRQSASMLLSTSPSSSSGSITNEGEHLRRSVAHTAASRFCRQHSIVQLESCVQLASALDSSLAAAAELAVAEAHKLTAAADRSILERRVDSPCIKGGGYSSKSGGDGEVNRSFRGCPLPLATLASPLPGANYGRGDDVRLALAVSPSQDDNALQGSGFCCVFLDGSDSSAWCDNVAADTAGVSPGQSSIPSRTILEVGFLNPPESPTKGTNSDAGVVKEMKPVAATRAAAVICRQTQAELETDIQSTLFLKSDDAAFFTSEI